MARIAVAAAAVASFLEYAMVASFTFLVESTLLPAVEKTTSAVSVEHDPLLVGSLLCAVEEEAHFE